ncbi:MAG: AMP nucleosidase [candidate division KSB1 bacterium]|jgi:AMP nucleosidase|nr:AMP nucleosidase [candidate division KSB1 bacterium]
MKPTKENLVRNWLPRYTQTPLKEFGEWILLTNFQDYVDKFAARFDVPVRGLGGPMTTATATSEGITIINYRMGSANAATIMDLLTAVKVEGVLFLGKCGGLKKATEIGRFILPIAAIRGDGTSDDYLLPEVPALPSFKLHKFISNIIIEHGQQYRTGVVYTTNRRVWEHDKEFGDYLKKIRVIGIDMETATIFAVGHTNGISRGALLLVSDMPLTPEGIKTDAMDREVSIKYVDMHLEIGIESLMRIREEGEQVKHFTFD